MACANTGITILALLNFAFTVWPNWGTPTTKMWVAGISSVLIIIFVWSGMECKCTASCKPEVSSTTSAPKKTVKKATKKAKKTKKK
jgi:hypothetical protein